MIKTSNNDILRQKKTQLNLGKYLSSHWQAVVIQLKNEPADHRTRLEFWLCSNGFKLYRRLHHVLASEEGHSIIHTVNCMQLSKIIITTIVEVRVRGYKTRMANNTAIKIIFFFKKKRKIEITTNSSALHLYHRIKHTLWKCFL